MGQGEHTETQRNRILFSNYNYCHFCGGHAGNNHTSATCKTPGPNHNHNVTRQNMMGGSTTGMHKTIMPEQCGQTVRREPQGALRRDTCHGQPWASKAHAGTTRICSKGSGNSNSSSSSQRIRRQTPMMMPNQMVLRYITPQMMMTAPAQMPMMQQQQMMAQPQQMMALMVQMQATVGLTEYAVVGPASTASYWIRHGITHREELLTVRGRQTGSFTQ